MDLTFNLKIQEIVLCMFQKTFLDCYTIGKELIILKLTTTVNTKLFLVIIASLSLLNSKTCL